MGLLMNQGFWVQIPPIIEQRKFTKWHIFGVPSEPEFKSLLITLAQPNLAAKGLTSTGRMPEWVCLTVFLCQ